MLSHVPLGEHWASWERGAPVHNNGAARVHVEIAGALVRITNVHLDWRDPAGRVREIGTSTYAAPAPTGQVVPDSPRYVGFHAANCEIVGSGIHDA